MNYKTSYLCDNFPESVDVVGPIFKDYGGISNFWGIITTIKCYESTSLIFEVLSTDGQGRVLLIDAGESKRRAVIDYNLAKLAFDNNWKGIVCYGSVRDVDELQSLKIGIKAIASIPVLADDTNEGEIDIPVNFAGVTFLPGDYLYADSTGIVISPDNIADEIF